MLIFFQRIWSFIRKVLGLLVPFGKKVTWKLSPTVRWTIHIILVVLVLVGLFILSEVLQLYLALPITNRFLARIWLPLLVFLLYIVAWIGWWLYTLWSTEEETQEFPDIEQAWEEAVAVLGQAGINLTEVPIFLILGRPEAGEAHLFHAAKVDLVVTQTPARVDAPLYVFATRDAVYVSCANTSLLGKYAIRLTMGNVMDTGASEDDIKALQSFDTPGSLTPNSADRDFLKLIQEELQLEGRPGSALERRSRQRLHRLRMPDLRTDTEMMAQSTARFQYLCHLIQQDRQPYCPINGLLLLVSFGSTDTQEEARQATELCQRDLATVRKVFQMRCPLFALVCDLETTWEFYEFVQRQKPANKLQRLGQRFPLNTDLHVSELRDQIESSVKWQCTERVRDWVYHLFQVEAEEEEHAETIAANTRLYQLLEMMYRRQGRLSSLLKLALLPGEDVPGRIQEPWFFGGCYFAATGSDPETEQAFVRGVLDRLNEAQASVCWTGPALEKDANNNVQVTIGYIILAVLWVAVVLFVVWQMNT